MRSRRTERGTAIFIRGSVRTLLWGLLLGPLLIACSNNNYAPIRDLERPPTVTKGVHVVRQGDTLYSIAWRYGRDFRQLAATNGIRWPYTIYKGQRISLAKTKPKKWVSSTTTQNKKTEPRQTVSRSDPKPAPVTTSKAPTWRWPVQGTIIGKFSANGSNKGIDIKAREGQPVRAAAEGTVVYAGSGLIGYGNLVIIKHSETYLSAYAHNKKILVREKKNVKAGEKIAEIGSSGASEIKLHFEIRKNGKPVNPLWYLPKRGN